MSIRHETQRFAELLGACRSPHDPACGCALHALGLGDDPAGDPGFWALTGLLPRWLVWRMGMTGLVDPDPHDLEVVRRLSPSPLRETLGAIACCAGELTLGDALFGRAVLQDSFYCPVLRKDPDEAHMVEVLYDQQRDDLVVIARAPGPRFLGREGRNRWVVYRDDPAVILLNFDVPAGEVRYAETFEDFLAGQLHREHHQVKTAADLRARLLALGAQHGPVHRKTEELQHYLRALLTAVDGMRRLERPDYRQIASLFEDACALPPAPVDRSWLRREILLSELNTPECRREMSSGDFVRRRLNRMIAELAVVQDDEPQLCSQVEGGMPWYNLTLQGFLEAGSRFLENIEEDEDEFRQAEGWDTLDDILTDGKSVE